MFPRLKSNLRLNEKKNIYILLALCVTLSACSIPRIVVLSDPLTAQEHNDLGVSYELMDEKNSPLKNTNWLLNRTGTGINP